MVAYDPANPDHSAVFQGVSVESLMAELEAVKAILAPLQEETKKAEAERSEINHEMEDLNRILSEKRLERNKKTEIIEANKGAIRDATMKIGELQHLLRQAELQANASKEWAKYAASIEAEAMSKDFKWYSKAFPHQFNGAMILARVRRSILGDRRGLGKTLTSLIYADIVGEAKRILIVGPKETIKNFEKEVQFWAPHRKLVSLNGKNTAWRDHQLEVMRDAKQAQFILTLNFESWRKDKSLLPLVQSIQCDTVIIDEAHAAKTPTSLVFRGLDQIVYGPNMCPRCGGHEFEIKKEGNHGPIFAYCMGVMSGATDEMDEFDALLAEDGTPCMGIYPMTSDETLSVKNVLPMTGTPILNKPLEMWPLLYLVDRESFPSQARFKDYYLTKDGKFRPGGEKMLLEKLGMRYLGRDRKSAGVTIPPQTIEVHELEFDPEKYPLQARAYAEIKHHFMLMNQDNTGITFNHAIVQILRLRQMITWPAGIKIMNRHKEIIFQCDVQQSQKLDYAVNHAKELIEEGERVVVFSQFKEPLREFKRRLESMKISQPGGGERYIRPCLLEGDTSDWMKEQIREDFDIKTAHPTQYRWDIVLANYKVGGQSINLTAASQMIILDEQWNPGMEDQAFGRIDRLDTPKETTVHIIRVMNSIDSWMEALKERKKRIIDGFDEEADLFREFFEIIANGGDGI